MTIQLDETDSQVVLALLGRLRGIARERARTSPDPNVRRAEEAHENVLAAIEAMLRLGEVGISEEERRRRALAVTALEDQLTAFGADHAP